MIGGGGPARSYFNIGILGPGTFWGVWQGVPATVLKTLHLFWVWQGIRYSELLHLH